MGLFKDLVVAWAIVGAFLLASTFLNSRAKLFLGSRINNSESIVAKITGFSRDGCVVLNGSWELCSETYVVLANISYQEIIKRIIKRGSGTGEFQINASCLKSLKLRCLRQSKKLLGKTVIVKVTKIRNSRIYGSALLGSSSGEDLWDVLRSLGCTWSPDSGSCPCCV